MYMKGEHIIMKRSKIKHILFDLDNTIYPEDTGVLEKIDNRITEYLVKKLKKEFKEIDRLRVKYRNIYGTTLRGAEVEHNIERDDYLGFVHDIAVETILDANEDLQKMLERINIDKSIFTNSTLTHAKNVLRTLNVERFFENIFDLKFCDYQGKPNKCSYKKVLDYLGLSPGECIMIDDLDNNLKAAHALGMYTVLIGKGKESYIDFSIDNILKLESILE